MAIYGYARVSTDGQNLDRQIDALKAVGVQEADIYTEKMSGTKKDRPQLAKLKEAVVEGDEVVVEALNRLSRSSSDLIDLMEFFNNKGVVLKSLKESIDFSTATGRMLSQLFAVLAKFERSCIAERVKEGVAAARKRGHVGGRPRVPVKNIKRALQMYEDNEFSVPDICKLCEVSKSSFFRYLKQHQTDDAYNEANLDS